MIYTIKVKTIICWGYIKRFTNFMLHLLIFNFMVRYLIENSLSFFIPFGMEVSMYDGTKVWFILLVTAISLLVFFMLFWLIILIYVCVNYYKIDDGSKISTIKSGLNEKSRFSMIYYFDYFGMRILLGVLAPLKINTVILFSIITVWQFIFMHIKIFWVYWSKKLSFTAYLAEWIVLITLFYSFFSYTKNDSSYTYIHKRNVIFFGIYFGLFVIMFLFNLTNMIIAAVWVIKWFFCDKEFKKISFKK